MKFYKWVEKGYAKLHWYDFGMVKLSAFLFGLLIAKIYPPILNLDWYWYLIFVVVVAYKPTYRFFYGKKPRKN